MANSLIAVKLFVHGDHDWDFLLLNFGVEVVNPSMTRYRLMVPPPTVFPA